MAQTQPIETTEQDNSVKEDDNGNSTAKQKDWKDRIVVGGNLGAQFGSSTYIEVSPIVGYKVTDKFTAGIGFSYQYFSENYNDPYFVDYKASVYGPRVFLQHDILFGFLHMPNMNIPGINLNMKIFMQLKLPERFLHYLSEVVIITTLPTMQNCK